MNTPTYRLVEGRVTHLIGTHKECVERARKIQGEVTGPLKIIYGGCRLVAGGATYCSGTRSKCLRKARELEPYVAGLRLIDPDEHRTGWANGSGQDSALALANYRSEVSA